MKAKIEDMYPLSPMQQGLLFHSLLAPGSGIYVPQICLALSGPIESTVLKTAWERALMRHTILRTGFQWEQRDEPFQVVYRESELSWVEQDWSNTQADEQAIKLQNFLAANRSMPFNLHRPPLMRITLIRRTESSHYLILCHHHLIMDGWSAGLLLQETLLDYVRTIQDPDTTRRLPGVQSRYADFIRWLKDQDPVQSKSFWETRLEGIQTHSVIPPNASAHVSRIPEMKETTFSLTEDESLHVRQFTKNHGLTLNNLLLGSLGIVFSRYTDNPEVTLGTTVSGRPPTLPDAMSMIGLLINTIPVRMAVSQNQSILSWLKNIQQDQSSTAPFQHVSLRDIQTWTHQGNPLFDCLFVLESYPVTLQEGAESGLIHLERVTFDEWTHLPLTLLATDGPALQFKAKFQSERLTAKQVDLLLQHIGRVLKAISQGGDQKLEDISMLGDAEHRLMDGWNQTSRTWDPTNQTLLELLNSTRTIEGPAVTSIHENDIFTFQDLHTTADRLAHQLQKTGAGPEDRVAVYMDRCVHLPLALLSIIKSGAAYLPLDPSQPLLRLQSILDASSPSAILVDGTQNLPELEWNAPLIDVRHLDAETQKGSMQSPRFNPENTAYVIYTSGSTGRPKGVINTHGAIVNRLLWMQDQYQLDISDRVLQKTPTGFDVSVWEFFWPMFTGSTLVMAPPEKHRDAEALVEMIRSEKITTVHFVPPMLDAFLEAPGVETCLDLKRIICSGDTLSVTAQKICHEKLPHVALHNLYGPTEAAIDVTAWNCQSKKNPSAVPIGKPIANTTIHLLDRHMKCVPIGIEGELYIGGTGLARAYLNQPGLTAERFLPNPFRKSTNSDVDPHQSETLYRTGDRARYREDGAIEFLGRQDNQIKIRGQRIELAEIDTALKSHPAISQAVSIVSDSEGRNDPQIIAYITLKPGQNESPIMSQPEKVLKVFLKDLLSDAMIPRQMVILDETPLTANGKLDRKALPKPPEQVRPKRVLPRNSTEQIILQIWEEILGKKDFGVMDHFFELGGHSLTATRTATRLRKQFKIKLDLRELFENPVLADLANHIDALRIVSQQDVTTDSTHIEVEID